MCEVEIKTSKRDRIIKIEMASLVHLTLEELHAGEEDVLALFLSTRVSIQHGEMGIFHING